MFFSNDGGKQIFCFKLEVKLRHSVDFSKVSAVFRLRKGVHFIWILSFSHQTKEENRWQTHSAQFTSEIMDILLHLGVKYVHYLGITFEFALFGSKFGTFYVKFTSLGENFIRFKDF